MNRGFCHQGRKPSVALPWNRSPWTAMATITTYPCWCRMIDRADPAAPVRRRTAARPRARSRSNRKTSPPRDSAGGTAAGPVLRSG